GGGGGAIPPVKVIIRSGSWTASTMMYDAPTIAPMTSRCTPKATGNAQEWSFCPPPFWLSTMVSNMVARPPGGSGRLGGSQVLLPGFHRPLRELLRLVHRLLVRRLVACGARELGLFPVEEVHVGERFEVVRV